MFIQTLQMKDFGNVTFQSLTDLPGAVAFFGYNGQGKTTAIHALQFLLFGYCDRTDKRGAGAEALIRDGAKKAEIACEIALDAETTIRVFATINRKTANEWGCCLMPDGEAIEGVEDRPGLWKRLGISMDHARVAAFPMQMLRSESLSDPLADYLSADLDLARLEALCAENFPWLVEFAKGKQMSPVYAALSGKPGAAKVEAKHFEEIGLYAFERRRELKAELKGEKYQIDNAAFIAPPENAKGEKLTPANIPAIEAQVARIQTTLDTLHVNLGAAQNAPDAEAIAVQRADAETALRAAEHVEAEARLAAEHDRAAWEKHAGEVQDLAQALANRNHAVTRHETDLAAVQAELAELDAPAGTCTTCGQKMNAAIKKEVIAPRKARIADLQASLATAQAAHAETLAALPPLREVVADLKSKADAASAKHRAAAAALATAQAMWDAIPLAYDGPTPDEIQAQIDVQRGQQVKATDALTRLRAIQEQEQNQKFIAATEAQIARLDWCVKAFKDSEILNQLLGSPVQEFEARCNAELSGLGYTLSILPAGKKLNVMLRCPDSAMPCAVADCSEGQQTLAAIAIASAFADTGAPVLVDNLNALDPMNRGAVLKRMKPAAMGSIVCASTWQQGRETVTAAAAALAPVAVYWVDKGAYIAGTTVAKVAA